VAGGERSADDIQRDIEKSRAALSDAVDQLAYRANPKRVTEKAKQTLRDKAQSPQGRAVIGVTGGLVVLLIIRRIRKH
jgi:osmotically-inducible protein OsmY